MSQRYYTTISIMRHVLIKYLTISVFKLYILAHASNKSSSISSFNICHILCISLTEKYDPETDEPKANPKIWKANFRCAINSLPDIEELKDQGKTKGNDAFKVYRLNPKKPKKTRTGKLWQIWADFETLFNVIWFARQCIYMYVCVCETGLYVIGFPVTILSNIFVLCNKILECLKIIVFNFAD